MIDRFIYKCFAALDKFCELLDKLFAPRCKCGKNKKNGK